MPMVCGFREYRQNPRACPCSWKKQAKTSCERDRVLHVASMLSTIQG